MTEDFEYIDDDGYVIERENSVLVVKATIECEIRYEYECGEFAYEPYVRRSNIFIDEITDEDLKMLQDSALTAEEFKEVKRNLVSLAEKNFMERFDELHEAEP